LYEFNYVGCFYDAGNEKCYDKVSSDNSLTCNDYSVNPNKDITPDDIAKCNNKNNGVVDKGYFLFVFLFVCLFICLFVYLFIYLFIYLFLFLSLFIFIYLSVLFYFSFCK
jgi:hypothetical protein